MPAFNWRSLLFAPAHNATLCEKAARAGADAVIIDLEDGVPPDAKATARERVPAVAAALAASGVDSVVRINLDWLSALEDLRAAATAGVQAIMAPKAEDPSRLAVLAAMLGEMTAGTRISAPGIIALVETPTAILALDRIAACPSVVGLALGTEDYSAALGVPPSRTLLELPSRMIAIATGGRMMALAVPFSIARFRDTEGYADAAAVAACHGVTGAICVHPSQVEIANRTFAPSAAQIDEARRLLHAWDAAQARGEAVVTHEGAMIDLPVALRAQRLISMAREDAP